DRAVLDEVPDPVVRPHGDVGAVARLIGGDEVGLQLVPGNHLDGDGDAVVLAPGLSGGLEGRGLLLIGPDHQIGVGASGSAALLAATVRGAAALGATTLGATTLGATTLIGAGLGRAATGGEHGDGGGEATQGQETLATDLHVFSFESWSRATGPDTPIGSDAGTVGRTCPGVQEYARTCRQRFGHGR